MEKKNKDKQEPFLVYFFFLTSLVILASVLRGIRFSIDVYSISYSVFVYPFIFLVLNYITRKYGYYKALQTIFISATIMIMFIVLTEAMFGKEIHVLIHLGLITSYILSSFVNLVIYYFLFMNTNIPKVTLFTNYLFAIIISEIVYLVLSLNGVLVGDFWMVFTLEVGIQSIFAFIFTIYENDKKLYS